MSSFLLKFEALESRIASYPCPQGTTGRVHALRLRRCFQGRRRSQSTLTQPSPQEDGYQDKPSQGRYVYFNHTPQGILKSDDRRLGQTSRIEPSGNHKQFLIPKKTLLLEHQYREPIFALSKSTENDGQNSIGLGDSEGDVLHSNFPDNVERSTPDLSALYKALRMGDPSTILSALIDLVNFDNLQDTRGVALRSIPSATFSEILRWLDPKHFAGPYTRVSQEIDAKLAKRLSLPLVYDPGYSGFCDAFLFQIRSIINTCRRARKDLDFSVQDYKYLLKCAGATGNIEAADSIWRDMKMRGVSFDVDCYNHYLAVLCWADTLDPALRYRLRVVPPNIYPRTWQNPPYRLLGHRVGLDGGIKLLITTLFKEMVRNGLAGDEETFCFMMIALAREGDIHGVAAILNRVWGIDVDLVMSKDERELEPPKRFRSDSPIYPSNRLLYTLSHAYGINNSIPTSLRLVDYVSRQYSLEISRDVWEGLLNWTYVLSCPRTGGQKKDGSLTGQLPPEAISKLWDAMTSEPYNVKPTMKMYDYLIKNLFRRERFGELLQRIEEGRRLHVSSEWEYEVRKFAWQDSLRRNGRPRPIERRRLGRELAFAALRMRLNRRYMKKWVQHLISRGSRKLRNNGTWTQTQIPEIMRRWPTYLPNVMEYRVAGGSVRFWSYTVNLLLLRRWQNRTGYGFNKRARSRKLKFLLSFRNLGHNRHKQVNTHTKDPTLAVS